jgi:IS30 family transposase
MLVAKLTKRRIKKMNQCECITNEKKGKHLTLEERKIIERMLRLGKSVKEIAEVLCRDETTIRREIKRGTVILLQRNTNYNKSPECPEFIEVDDYRYDVGQRVYKENRANSVWSGKFGKCQDLVNFVAPKIKPKGIEKLSPDTALGSAREKNLFVGQYVSTKTFYNWIDKGKLKSEFKVDNFDLLRKVGRKPNKKGDISNEHKKILGKSIEERPSIVESREEFGHWEGDFIVGKNQESYLFTLVERKHRIGFIFEIASREKHHVVEIIDMLEKKYGKYFKSIFKTITFDNGSEFSDSVGMERGGRLSVYYAHPRSSYERGSNENWNGLVRRALPKGSCFKNLTESDIERIVNCINSMPRKILGYKTSLELWEKEINAIMSA